MATKRLKRPRDPIQLGKLIDEIATGQVEDREPTPEERGKDPAASAMGRKRRRSPRRKLDAGPSRRDCAQRR